MQCKKSACQPSMAAAAAVCANLTLPQQMTHFSCFLLMYFSCAKDVLLANVALLLTSAVMTSTPLQPAAFIPLMALADSFCEVCVFAVCRLSRPLPEGGKRGRAQAQEKEKAEGRAHTDIQPRKEHAPKQSPSNRSASKNAHQKTAHAAPRIATRLHKLNTPVLSSIRSSRSPEGTMLTLPPEHSNTLPYSAPTRQAVLNSNLRTRQRLHVCVRSVRVPIGLSIRGNCQWGGYVSRTQTDAQARRQACDSENSGVII